MWLMSLFKSSSCFRKMSLSYIHVWTYIFRYIGRTGKNVVAFIAGKSCLLLILVAGPRELNPLPIKILSAKKCIIAGKIMKLFILVSYISLQLWNQQITSSWVGIFLLKPQIRDQRYWTLDRVTKDLCSLQLPMMGSVTFAVTTELR